MGLRDLSIYGKVQIIKTFAISQLVLVGTLLPVPKGIETDINDIFFKFIWKSKDKVKRLKLFKHGNEGGVNMTDISTMFEALKASWVFRIQSANQVRDGWMQLADYFTQNLMNTNTIIGLSLGRETLFPILEDMHPFYKEVVRSYSYANNVNLYAFCDNISNQPLWGNKFININVKGRMKALFLRNWIHSGVSKIGDLEFVDGKLDEAYLYRIIADQSNKHAEIMIVKKALMPYAHLLVDLATLNQGNCNKLTLMKSKDCYQKLIKDKCSHIEANHMCPELSDICANMNMTVEDAFKNQLCSKIELKLREFNFKVLYGILPCNVNLVRWRLFDSDICDLCDSKQTIKHLLFECKRACHLWDIVNKAYNIRIEYGNIVCGFSSDDQLRSIVTLVAFLLYKEWLLRSLSRNQRCIHFPYDFYICELKLREKIYRSSMQNEMYLNADSLIDCLECIDV